MARSALLESPAAKTSSFRSHNSDLTMKRKTPSELRGEQLKRRGGEPLRVNELFPVKKLSERCRVLNGKDKAKDSLTTGQTLNDLLNPTACYRFAGKQESSVPCDISGKLNNPVCSNPFSKDTDDQGSLKIEKYNQHNVAELHLGKTTDFANKIDMEKALKELVTNHVRPTSLSLAEKFGRLDPSIPSINLFSELPILGHRPPLDFTLKTTLRLVSSASVKWCHRLSRSLGSDGINQFSSVSYCNMDRKFGCNSGLTATAETRYSKALHSWAYPQSSLPPSIISAMAMSSTREEKDFILKRQQDWEDSFQNLYYLLRKNLCNIFYVRTSQFIVLFVGGNFWGEKKRPCNAYVSQSTRGLRSLLRKHDICFSMPLCRAEVEQAADDDMVELSEIEKQNLGQTFHLDSLSEVDNSPQSLLAFFGNENVHSLYDFLVNYRFSLNSLAVMDVPVLYSPVPFKNSSLSIPEVRCKEMKRADNFLPSSRESESDGGSLSTNGICYSIEIKDTVLPPWVICGLCVAMGSNSRAFEASFTTDPASNGLNVALDVVCEKSELPTRSNKSAEVCGDVIGIPDAVVSPHLRSGLMKKLKYLNGSYVVHLTPA